METLSAVVERMAATLAELDNLTLSNLPLPRRDQSVIIFGIVALLALAALLTQTLLRRRAGRT